MLPIMYPNHDPITRPLHHVTYSTYHILLTQIHFCTKPTITPLHPHYLFILITYTSHNSPLPSYLSTYSHPTCHLLLLYSYYSYFTVTYSPD